MHSISSDQGKKKYKNMITEIVYFPFSGPLTNEDGDIIISEEEYLEIRRLKDLKQAYRADFDELKNLKSEVMYCQKLVDQTRQSSSQSLTTGMRKVSWWRANRKRVQRQGLVPAQEWPLSRSHPVQW